MENNATESVNTIPDTGDSSVYMETGLNTIENVVVKTSIEKELSKDTKFNSNEELEASRSKVNLEDASTKEESENVKASSKKEQLKNTMGSEKKKSLKKKGSKKQVKLTKKEKMERRAILAAQHAKRMQKKSWKQRGYNAIEFQRARFRLAIRRLRAANRKGIPPETKVVGPKRVHLQTYDRYFVDRVEPAMNDIYWAAFVGNVGRMMELIELECVDPKCSLGDPWGFRRSPLHWAARGGQVEAIQMLLGKGADLHAIDDSGSLPIHLACYSGHAQATIALVKAGDISDLSAKDYDAGLTPLEWASFMGHTEIIPPIHQYAATVWLPDLVAELVYDILKGRYSPKEKGPPRKKLDVKFARKPSKAAPKAGKHKNRKHSKVPTKNGKEKKSAKESNQELDIPLEGTIMAQTMGDEENTHEILNDKAEIEEPVYQDGTEQTGYIEQEAIAQD